MEIFPHPSHHHHVCALEREIDGDSSVLFVVTNTAPRLEASATIWGVGSEAPRLADVYVDPACRHNRHGTALTRAAQRWAKRNERPLYLYVDPGNEAARALYEELGWIYTGSATEAGDLWMAAPHCQTLSDFQEMPLSA